LGQQFALNEASFFLVRLLQTHDKFELALDAQPEGSLPPKDWAEKPGRAAVDKIWFQSSITMFVRVSAAEALMLSNLYSSLGRVVD
jgi:hypothetical protein